MINRYGGLTRNELKRLTHEEPPWVEADHRREAGGSERIDLTAMREYFASLTGEDDEVVAARDPGALRRWLDGLRQQAPGAGKADSVDELRRRLSNA